MIPAYGWRVTINKNTVITDNTTPVINRCLFHNGLSRRLITTALIPFITVKPIIAA